MVERFDRIATRGTVRRVPQEDVIQLCATCEDAIPRLPDIGFDERRTRDLQQVMAKRIADLRD